MTVSTISKTILRTTASLSAVTVFALAGCSAQAVPDEDSVEVDPIASTESALCILYSSAEQSVCPTSSNANAAHRHATRLLKYVFGDNNAIPDTTNNACTAMKGALDVVRSRLVARTATASRSTQSVCGRTSTVYKFSPNNGVQIWDNTTASAFANWVDACTKVTGTSGFTLVSASSSSSGCSASEVNANTSVALDPEPATLSANLSGSSYAYAAAVTTSGEQETAHRWPSTGTYTTSLVNNGAGQSVNAQYLAGRPCLTGTTTAYAGTQVAPRLAIIGSKVYCK